MKSEQVKKIVPSLHGTKDKIRPLKITFDNMFVVDEQKDVILWDDENELVTIILPVDDYQRQTTTPIGVKVFSYDEIQKIEAFFDMDSLDDMITDINVMSSELITEEFGIHVKNYFKSLYKTTTQNK